MLNRYKLKCSRDFISINTKMFNLIYKMIHARQKKIKRNFSYV